MDQFVFISHAKEDRKQMEIVLRFLEDRGIRCWVAPRNIEPGGDYAEAIMDASEKCAMFVLLFSEHADKSPHVEREVEHAVSSRVPILPMRIQDVPISKRLRYFTGVHQWLDAFDPSLESHLEKLGATIQAALQKHNASPAASYAAHPVEHATKVADATESPSKPASHFVTADNYRVATTADLYANGWSSEKLVDELLRMDYDTLDGLNEHHAGNMAQWVPVVNNNPDGMRFVVNRDGRIVGYWHFVALMPEWFAKAKQGELFDGDITLRTMQILGFPGEYNVHFIIIAILPEFRGFKVMRLLFNAFCESLIMLAESDMFIDEICATAFSEEGLQLCKSARMTYLCDHVDHGSIFGLSLREVPPPFDKCERLRQLYQEHYRIP